MVKEHISVTYPSHLKIFTDGSVMDSLDSGAAFVIPDMKLQKSFYLGNGYSIFTAELFAIFMALQFIADLPIAIYSILFCVDSVSVLRALNNWNSRVRRDLIFEIKHLIHCISSKSIGINFCWVPSHCGFYWNEVADNLAKQGALRSEKSICFSTLHLSSSEINSLLTRSAFVEFQNNKNSILSCPRNVASLIYKLRLNSWKTKYSENISCICLGKISVHHIFFECPGVLKLMSRWKYSF